MIKKILLGLLLIIAASFFAFRAGNISVVDVFSTAEAPRHRVRETSQVTTEVTVFRDKMGVPHIYGDDSHDILFAVGFTMAEDRLFQFELIRRVAAGELAEIFGPDSVDSDIEARTIGYTEEQLQQMLDEMTPFHRSHLESYVAGVNDYVQQMRDDPDQFLPLEFQSLAIEPRDYRPHDVLESFSVPVRLFGAAGGNELTNLAFLEYLQSRYDHSTARTIFDDVLILNDPEAYSFTSPSTEVLTSLPALAKNEDPVSPPVATDGATLAAERRLTRQSALAKSLRRAGLSQGASRSMVIGPHKSANGNVLMMQGTADGHEAHISGGGFDVAGLAFVSTGLPVMGRTNRFGWLVTTTERDTVDLFAEELNSENKYAYRFNGEWREMVVRSETITVADSEAITIDVASTVHGPVVSWNEDANIAYAKKWAVWMREAIGWAAFFEFARADSFQEFESIVQRFIMNGNYSYGDVDGHIQTWHFNTLPIRAAGVDPRLPTPGTGEFEWQRLESFEEFPTISDPEHGFNFVWNNKPSPDTTYGDGSRWGRHFRTHLPLSLLRADDSISIQDLETFNRTIAAGWGSVNLQTTSPEFFHAFWDEALEHQSNAEVSEAVRLMKCWDGLYRNLDDDGYYDNLGLTLFRTWLPIAMETVFEDDLGGWWHKFDDHLYIKYGTSLLLRVLDGKNASIPANWDFLNGERRESLVYRSLVATVEVLAERFESRNMNEWKQPLFWRYMSSESLLDPDAQLLPTPAYGESASVPGASVALGFLEEAVVHNGMPDWTAIMEFGDSETRLRSAIPSGGQSWFINTGFQASPHINDQYKMHRDFEYKTIEMVKENVLKDVESTLIFRPAD